MVSSWALPRCRQRPTHSASCAAVAVAAAVAAAAAAAAAASLVPSLALPVGVKTFPHSFRNLRARAGPWTERSRDRAPPRPRARPADPLGCTQALRAVEKSAARRRGSRSERALLQLHRRARLLSTSVQALARCFLGRACTARSCLAFLARLVRATSTHPPHPPRALAARAHLRSNTLERARWLAACPLMHAARVPMAQPWALTGPTLDSRYQAICTHAVSPADGSLWFLHAGAAADMRL